MKLYAGNVTALDCDVPVQDQFVLLYIQLHNEEVFDTQFTSLTYESTNMPVGCMKSLKHAQLHIITF